MKNYLNNTLLFIIISILLSGCETLYNSNSSSKRSEREETMLRQELKIQQSQYEAEAARRSVESVEGHISRIENRIDNLERASVSATWATVDDVAVLRNEIAALRADVNSARAEHDKLRTEIVTNVENLIKAQLRKVSATPKSISKSGYEHKVESGQTLSEIAKAYGVTVSKIKEANNLKNDNIRIGQTLFIPD